MYYSFDCDLWERLECEKNPIVLYGTGNGADKILAEFENRGIHCDGVFASNDFVRNREFHGMKVESLDRIADRLGENITIVLCFGSSRPEVISYVKSLSEKYKLVIPEVPLYGGELFNLEYLKKKEDCLMRARELFDDESKPLFDDAVAFRITGDIKYLMRTEPLQKAVERLAKRKKIRTAIDIGAYNGDTAKIFATIPDIKKIIAVEPDKKSFEKLKSNLSTSEADSEILFFAENFAASDTECTVRYSMSGSRGAGLEGQNRRAKENEVVEKPLDFLGIKDADFIKFDVEGNESKALYGAEETIKAGKSALAVSLYHRTDDFFELPFYIKETFPHITRFSLTRPECFPFWDFTLICD